MDVLILLMPSYVLNLSEQTDRKILYICLYFLGLVLLQLGVNWIAMRYEHLAFRFRYFQIPSLAAVIMRKNTAYIDSTEGKEEIEQAYQAVFQGGNAGIEFYFIQWSNFFRSLLSCVIAVVMIGIMGKSLWIIGVVIVLCVLYMIYIRVQRKLEMLKKEELQPKMMERYLTKTLFEENFQMEIRVFQMQEWMIEKFKRVDNRLKDLLQQMNRRRLSQWIVVTGGILLCLLVSLFGIVIPVFSMLSFFEASILLYLLFQLQQYISTVFSSSQQILLNEQYIQQWLQFIEEGEKQANEGKTIEKIETIEFKQVSYRPPHSNRELLKQVTFKWEFPKNIAIVGVNGAGKTTLIKLLCGLLEPTEGTILVNGIPLTEYSLDSWKKCLGVLFQDDSLFAFTIAENIAFSTEVDEEKIEEVLRKVHLWEVVNALPKRVHTPLTTMLDSDGVNFSGGQLQRLQLARVLYRSYTLGIFDEPTASLDAIEEKSIYQLIAQLKENGGNIFISHRLGSTQFCDVIVVLKDGQIQASGTHDELVQKNEDYRKLYCSQMYYYQQREGVK